MAKILSGKQVAEALTAKVRARADHLSGQGLAPKLVIVRLGEDPSDLAYERGAPRSGLCWVRRHPKRS